MLSSKRITFLILLIQLHEFCKITLLNILFVNNILQFFLSSVIINIRGGHFQTNEYLIYLLCVKSFSKGASIYPKRPKETKALKMFQKDTINYQNYIIILIIYVEIKSLGIFYQLKLIDCIPPHGNRCQNTTATCPRLFRYLT